MMLDGTLYSREELERMDALVIMQVHDRDVYVSEDLGKGKCWEECASCLETGNYAEGFDFVIKRYMSDCYNLRHYIFLFCATLSNHERQSDQRIVIQKARTVSTVKNPIVFQKPKEQKRCDAFVAVTERVVLDRQVKQIGCLFLDTRIEITPAEGLVNCPHCAFERFVFFVSEQFAAWNYGMTRL
jgi:hypothetical protein